MKIAVTGAQGVIGNKLIDAGCVPLFCNVTKSHDITNEMLEINPNVVIHCAALTDVAYCENHFKESFDINVRGTANVVEAMPKDTLFIYLSSDHVFSGQNYFYEGYGEWQKPSPVNRYGFSKWGGELAAQTGKCRTIIVRGSKVFYWTWARDTIYDLQNGKEIVFTDLIKRSFYHVNHFIEGLLYLAHHYEEFPKLDIINISGDGVYSYYMFWSLLQKYLDLPGKIKPRSSKLENETPRPFRGGLDIRQSKRLGFPIHPIQDGFELIKQEI